MVQRPLRHSGTFCGRELTVGRVRGLMRVHRQRQQRRCLYLRTRRLRPVLSLLCDPCVTVWTDGDGVALFAIQIRFNNVRPSPLILIPNIPGLLRPRVLKPLLYPRLS